MSEHVNILEKQIVLQLNANWQVIGTRSVKDAIVALCSQSNGAAPAFAMDMEMATDENGVSVLVYATPTPWEKWLDLPIRDQDLYIQSAHQKIRVPTVIVARNFKDMPMKRPHLSSGGIWMRDQGVCQYSGKKLPRHALNVDHVVPRDRGGKDEWTNMVLADKNLNSLKGNKLNSEAGLRLIRQPKAPPALPASATIKEANHPTWIPFLLS